MSAFPIISVLLSGPDRIGGIFPAGILKRRTDQIMDTGTLLSFFLLALLLSCTPGPDWAFVLGQAMRGRGTVAPVLGIGLGYLGLATLTAVGVGTLVSRHELVLQVISALGAMVLLYLAVAMLRAAWQGDTDLVGEEQRSRGRLGVFFQGAGVAGLNPKGLMLFVALLPQFIVVGGGGWAPGAQMMVLGLVFVGSAMFCYGVLGLVMARVPASGGLSRAVCGLAGVAMSIFAVGMLASQFAGF